MKNFWKAATLLLTTLNEIANEMLVQLKEENKK